ncbi:MAG: FAS1-like dehydratase domain-containing protein [Pseudomonadota bacterium]
MANVAQAPFPLTFGTYEEALKLVGQAGEKTVAEFSVTHEAIKVYCSLVEDANASYWDERYARRRWGGIVAPPGLLLSWCMALQWHPHKARSHYIMALRVPLPGDTLINVATTTEFDRHLYLGDRVSVQDRLVQISAEKNTRLGIGHFLTTEAEFVNQNGERVALQTNQLFRYRTHEA